MSSVPNAHKWFAQPIGQGGTSKFANGDAVNDTLADIDIGDGTDQFGRTYTPENVDGMSIDVWVQANHAVQDVDKEIDSVSVQVFYQTSGGAIIATSMNVGPSVGL